MDSTDENKSSEKSKEDSTDKNKSSVAIQIEVRWQEDSTGENTSSEIPKGDLTEEKTEAEKVAEEIYNACKPQAVSIKIWGQMLVGILVVFSLFVHLIVRVAIPDFAIDKSIELISLCRCQRLTLLLYKSEPLKIVGFWLSISAGLELAYMLYTPGPDEAIEPLILGVTSALLIIISGVDAENMSWQLALTVLVLSGTLGFLFYIREKFIESEKRRKKEQKRRQTEASTKSDKDSERK